MKPRDVAIGGVALIAVTVAPINLAFAHGWHRGGPVFGLFALGAAAVAGAAIIATAPVRALAAPVYAPAPTYYPPLPTYYAPAPAYYPPPGYYAQPPG